MKIPYETLFRKGLAIGLNKLNFQQGMDLARALIASAKSQMEANQIDYKDTYVFKKFGKIFTQELFDKFDAEEVSKLIAHPEACLFYMRYFIWPECSYWQYNIHNTAEDFAGLFKNVPVDAKQVAYNKILATPDQDFKTWMALFKEHEADLIDETEEDPANYFGFTAFEASQKGFVNPLVDLGIEHRLELTPEQASLPKITPLYKNLPRAAQVTQTSFQEKTWPVPPDPLNFEALKSIFPLHKVQDYLFNTRNKTFEKIAFAFDGCLWMSDNFFHASKDNLEKVLVHVKLDQGVMQIEGMTPLTTKEAAAWETFLVNKSQDAQRAAFIWDVRLNKVAAGYMFKQQPANFAVLVNQLKFLNGDLNYPNGGMLEWVQAHQPRNLKAAFDLIRTQRVRNSREGQDIEAIFIKTGQLAYEEQI